MHPFLVDGLSTYGVAMAAAYLSATLLGLRAARREGIDDARLLDLSFWVLASSLLGSRLLFVALHAGEYGRACLGSGGPARTPGEILVDCSRPLHLWEGGYVFFGGLLAAVLVSLWYARRHALGFWRLADLAAPLVAMGHVIGRLGCFAAGCCYGKPASGGLGLAFPRGSLAYLELVRDGVLREGTAATMPLHPTQLYEALAELTIYIVLLLVGARRRYTGQVFVVYLLLYGAARFVIEIFRGDPGRGHLVAWATPDLSRWLGLSPEAPVLLSFSQGLCLVVLVGAPLLGRALRRRSRSLPAPDA